ncbi:MAG: choice-of-anchor E domain-containing protein [Acetobacteraceae bacterium]
MFITKSWLRAAGISAVAAAAFSLAPLSARAGTLSETVNVASTPTNWSQTLNFQGFDALATAASLNPSQLILSSITIALTEKLSGTAQATNTSNGSITTSFNITNTGELNAGGLGTVVDSQSSGNVTIPAGGTSAVQDLSGSNSATNTYSTNLAQFLPAWTGAGSDTAFEGVSGGGGNLQATFTDSGALSVLVTYNYGAAPVPEPATIAVFGVALLALGLIRTKRA